MLMLVLFPVIVALFCAAVSTVTAFLLLRRSRGRVLSATVPARAEVETRQLVRTTQRRMICGILAGLVVTIVVAALPIDHVQSALAIAPGLGAAATLLVIAGAPFPRRTPARGLRTADLTPRGIGTFGPRWGFVLPLVAAVCLVLLLVATGSTSSPDDFGRLREFQVRAPQQINVSGPYPGWFYALPILVSVLVLIAALLTALHRITAAPRIGSADAAQLDSRLRSALTRFGMLLGSSVIVLYLGAITLTASAAMRSASQWQHLKPAILRAQEEKLKANGSASFIDHSGDFVHGVVQPSYTAGAIGSLVGILLIGFAIVLAMLAVTSIVIRWSVVAEAARETVPA
jgi:hypothetical protein